MSILNSGAYIIKSTSIPSNEAYENYSEIRYNFKRLSELHSSASHEYIFRVVKIIETETVVKSSKNYAPTATKTALVVAAFVLSSPNVVADDSNDYLGLPCPKYCDPKEAGNKLGVVKKISNTKQGFNTSEKEYKLSLLIIKEDLADVISNYVDSDITNILTQENCKGIVPIIIEHNGVKKEAIIGLDQDGRFLPGSKVVLRNENTI